MIEDQTHTVSFEDLATPEARIEYEARNAETTGQGAMSEKWIPCTPDTAGVMVRFRDDSGSYRQGRVRATLDSMTLDNGSVVQLPEEGVELLDLSSLSPYDQHLQAKLTAHRADSGQALDPDRLHESLFHHQRDIVAWAYRQRRAAIFASFGLGKTRIQLELLHAIYDDQEDDSAMVLQVAPLGVHQEFLEQAEELGIVVHRIRHGDEARPGLNLIHYEAVRDGKINPRLFCASSLDEAAVLRGMGSTETFRNFMLMFEGLPCKFVATATPSPNDIMEIAAYSAYLEILSVGDIKTRFFQRNSEQANDLTLHPHRAKDFWLWLASWALFIESPTDLGHDGSAYVLPPIHVNWHMVEDPEDFQAWDREGQGLLVPDTRLGLSEAAALKRATLPARLEKAKQLVDAAPGETFLLWHDLEDERREILKLFPEAVDIHGSMDRDERDRRLMAFKTGHTRLFATKPRLSAAGCNFQRHCHRAIFCGVGFKAYDVLQAARRIHRFGQEHPVQIDLIYARSESSIKETLQRKWAEDVHLRATMCEIVQQYGLTATAIQGGANKSTKIDASRASGQDWVFVHNDSVLELAAHPDASAGMILTSPPFSSMYKYADSVRDMSHSDDNEHFFQGMSYLTKHLLRVLQPGRVMVIHAKDRVTPGNLSGLGFGTIYPFSDACVRHYVAHGFAFMARVTVSTDVVRENASTYRLGYTEKAKDATKLGHGLPEYLLIFRKPPSSRETAYADEPVIHDKPSCLVGGEVVNYQRGKEIVPGSGWSVAEWQTQAAGFWRSSGNRALSFTELACRQAQQVYRAWKAENSAEVYDYHRHVRLAETLQKNGRLPPGFSLVPPHALRGDPNVWTDVARMRTLNMVQQSRGQEMHLCPMQFDIADRCIELWSNPGDLVLDPFAGIGTVPLRAVKLGRRALGIELNLGYWRDGATYLKEHDEQGRQTTLFDLLGQPDAEAVAA